LVVVVMRLVYHGPMKRIVFGLLRRRVDLSVSRYLGDRHAAARRPGGTGIVRVGKRETPFVAASLACFRQLWRPRRDVSLPHVGSRRRFKTRSLRVTFALAVIVACKDANAPQPANAGDECAIGGRVTRPCAGALTCKAQPFTAPPPMASGEVQSPEKPSPLGGGCGGVAGFHCADGLGSCVQSSKCQ
jgi:hypothetical protein